MYWMSNMIGILNAAHVQQYLAVQYIGSSVNRFGLSYAFVLYSEETRAVCITVKVRLANG